MATDTNPEFQKFWAQYRGLLLAGVACDAAKQAFRAAFVAGELAEMDKVAQRAGREALDSSAAHASSG